MSTESLVPTTSSRQATIAFLDGQHHARQLQVHINTLTESPLAFY